MGFPAFESNVALQRNGCTCEVLVSSELEYLRHGIMSGVACRKLGQTSSQQHR